MNEKLKSKTFFI